jgi:hypothetical protein
VTAGVDSVPEPPQPVAAPASTSAATGAAISFERRTALRTGPGSGGGAR